MASLPHVRIYLFGALYDGPDWAWILLPNASWGYRRPAALVSSWPISEAQSGFWPDDRPFVKWNVSLLALQLSCFPISHGSAVRHSVEPSTGVQSDTDQICTRPKLKVDNSWNVYMEVFFRGSFVCLHHHLSYIVQWKYVLKNEMSMYILCVCVRAGELSCKEKRRCQEGKVDSCLFSFPLIVESD